MGLSGDDLADYAKEVVQSDFEKSSDDDVLEKVRGDLKAKGLEFSERQVRKQMDDLLFEAKQQVMTE